MNEYSLAKVQGKNMNTKCIKKSIALVAMTMICCMATARPHHHFRHAPKRVTTVVYVGNESR